ncbi:MAG TPA: DUF4388 domain-containing protein [Myxococcaceae bacterium]|nr:DUF4388 domain-containing protein [Myxococcaceae bacterium]
MNVRLPLEEVRPADAGHVPPSDGAADAVSGQLTDKPFPEVLGELHRTRATGALMVRRGEVRKIIYLRDGIPESVKSNLPSERLGRVLVRERMISEAECEESLRRMKATRRQQGAVLVEMGRISPHNLEHALRLQARAKLWEIFGWDDGEYLFKRVDPPPPAVRMELSAVEALYEGIKRAFHPLRLERVLGELSALSVLPHEEAIEVRRSAGLGPDEMRSWNAIDGHQTVGELVARGRLPPPETTALVWALRCAGLVDFKDPGALPPPLPRRGPPPLKKRAPAEMRGSLLPELSPAQEGVSASHGPEHERLTAELAAMRQQDHFKNLGISRNAAPSDVKQAYVALAEEYDPSGRFSSAPLEVRELAARIHELLTAAYQTLSDPAARAAYARKIAFGARAAVNGGVGKLVAAEGRFRKGQELMRNGRFLEAWEQFEEAIRLYPEEGEFHAWLGWAIFQSAPASRKAIAAALEYIDQAIRLNPRGETGYLFSGQVHRAAGHPDLAREHFEKAVECNPGCTEALQQLRGGQS